MIEILVVMAIIATLLLILLPVVGRWQARAESTRCTNNLREIGLAILAYAVDHNNQIIPSRAVDEGPGNDPYWSWKLVNRGYLPQVTGAKVLTAPEFYCPSSAVPSPDKVKSWANLYGLRQWRVPGASRHDVYNPMGAVDEPSNFLLLADSVSTSTGLPWLSIGTGSNANTQRIHLRHNGRANCFFLDGRVVSMDVKRLQESRERTAIYGWNPIFEWTEQ